MSEGMWFNKRKRTVLKKTSNNNLKKSKEGEGL
jgi:hypothetical protein